MIFEAWIWVLKTAFCVSIDNAPERQSQKTPRMQNRFLETTADQSSACGTTAIIQNENESDESVWE
jgi:hypothetical protein